MKSINQKCHCCHNYFILKYKGNLDEFLNKDVKYIFCPKCRKSDLE